MAAADSYLEAWRARARAEDARASAWRLDRIAEAQRAARALASRLQARRVL